MSSKTLFIIGSYLIFGVVSYHFSAWWTITDIRGLPLPVRAVSWTHGVLLVFVAASNLVTVHSTSNRKNLQIHAVLNTFLWIVIALAALWMGWVWGALMYGILFLCFLIAAIIW